MIRSDQFLTKLGDRGDRGLFRLWIEETSFNRLDRSGFGIGTGFEAAPRMGPGFILRPAALGSCHVSGRGKAKKDSILSFEFRKDRFPVSTTDVRVKITTNAIFILPSLRLHSIARTQSEHWTIDGMMLRTPAGETSLATVRPLAVAADAASITANLTEANLVFATEVIQRTKPGTVRLAGESLLCLIAGQFLAAAGYGPGTEANEWKR